MKRYDSYKNSGVEWIGEIPSSWNKTKLKYKLQEVITGGTPDTSNDSFWGDQDGINWISISDITSNGREITETKKFISEKGLESKKLQILPIGSLIYSIYGSIGKISRLGIPSTVHQGILGLKTNSTYDTTFLEYYLIYFKEYVSLFSSSNTQENLNQEKVSNFDIPVPPLSEQQQIVSFLDTKTSLIDSLIEKTQRKIELLKEKRTSLINEVVTKGLNPNVEMKDSGVEWIGEIPSHWVSTPLKRIVKIGNGKDYKHIEVEVGGYPVYGTGGVFSRCSEYLHTGPSVLLGRKGTIDNPLFVNEPFWTSDTIYYTIIDESKIIPSLLFRLVHQIPFDLFSYGSTIPSMTKTDYEEMKFPLPPTSEQKQIVEYLDEHTQLIDKTISIEEKRIELLKEYRQSLISEVVTGKLKCENELIMSISYEHFLNKIKDYKGEKNLDVLLIKMYKKTLRDSMIFVNSFIHQQSTLNKDISLEEYIIELLYTYEYRKRDYQEVMSEINSRKYDNKRYETKIYLEKSKKYIDVMEDYLSFINDVENGKYTPNELIERLVIKLNRFLISMYKKDKNLIYEVLKFDEELKFDLVDSFGYDDGIHDVLQTHFGFWSNEYQLGLIEIEKVYGQFERVYEHFDDLSELKSSLNSMKVNLKSPF